MLDLLRAAGLDGYEASEHDIHGSTVVVVRVEGRSSEALRSARAGLTDHYPVLVDDIQQVIDPDFHHKAAPASLIADAGSLDLDARIAELSARWLGEREPGSDDDALGPEHYDIAGFGESEALVILPRPEPWSVFAYLGTAWTILGADPETMLAAGRRWYDRYGAEPTVAGLATGFVVPRPPADPAEAWQVAVEHVTLAGLTARTTLRGYARSLETLPHWTLYNRP
ncbi:DUF4253 domain-containing protein [Winogradskya humida]|uniref:DUF4253 domain-containing protein n=1 Tax=Winogradskya humida TaxID=113566 RepID=A0ABQ3ZVC0_9ACTN|nr:DUF4253 domain-containing protein [Actinoplanes humidus]GIE22530.1 hypothetical protein Ahu01nite_056320 [Actinoplanes humidus]